MLASVTEQLHRQRRRGEELEAALLGAAWDELVEAGFGKLTMESVAARAKTGVAVLYRRWPRKDDLVIAAIGQYGRTHPVDVPDTGSLREDLLALLNRINEERGSFIAVISASFAGLLAGTGMTPAEVRLKLIGDRLPWSGAIFDRAHERGEIDLNTLPVAVQALPFDLIRHDLMLTLAPVSPERLASIVDDVFVPLVSAYRDGRAAPREASAPPAGHPLARGPA
jgi:AcrR family transcriptional regulator